MQGSEEFGEDNIATTLVGLGIQGKKHVHLAHGDTPWHLLTITVNRNLMTFQSKKYKGFYF